MKKLKPDVILAEPVGSCAGMMATLYMPLREFYSKEFEIVQIEGASIEARELLAEYEHVVSTNMHIHLRGDYCVEVLIAEGEIYEVVSFISRIRALKGLYQVRYTVITVSP